MRTMHLASLFATGGMVALMAFGCSSDPTVTTGSGGGDATASSTSASVTVTSSSAVVTSSSTGGMMDESTSCADAVTMEEINNNGVIFYRGTGVVNPAKDADFFTFSATEGEWIGMFTVANDMDDPMKIDTVLTLFNEDGTQKLAEVDDAFPRVTTDSEMFYRVPTTGTYCLKVWEFSDWAQQDPEGDPSYSYEVDVLPIDAAILQGYDPDAGNNDDAMTAQELSNATVNAMTDQIFTRVYGLLDPGTDADWYKFTAPNGSVGASTIFTPSGPDGFGSTGGIGIVNLWDGTTKHAVLDYALGSDGFSQVPITPGKEYFVEITRANATVGANDFYFKKIFTSAMGNGQETDDTLNNTAMGAEVAVGQASNNPMTTLHFLGGTIPPGDTDWWTIDTDFAAGVQVTVVCSSQRAGSGVGDMKVEMFEEASPGVPAAASVQSETETDQADLLWSSTAMMASKMSPILTKQGKPLLKIDAQNLNATGATSTHYLCGFHFTTP